MFDPRDFKLDVTGIRTTGNEPANPRPFLRVQFACCNVYQRIYRHADARSYQGRCPRCGKPVKFLVGPEGTGVRDFVVY